MSWQFIDWQSIIILVVVIVFLIWLYQRLSGPAKNPSKPRIAIWLINQIDDNFKIIYLKKNDSKNTKKFNISSWIYYQQFINFVDPETVTSLKEAYAILTKYNAEVDATATGTNRSITEISWDTLWDLLVKSRAGLSVWVRENINRGSVRGLFTRR